VIDDEPSVTRSLERVLTDRGYQVEVASDGRVGLEIMERQRPHIVLCDVRLPDTSGFDLIPRLHKVESAVQVIVITAFGDTKAAVRAMKLGASDFLRKPYDLDELLLAVDTASKTFSRDAHLTVYRRKDRSLYNPDQILWRSEAMGRVWDLVRKVARSNATSALITGESGTGKELVARGIHFEGARRRAPFMGINCSAFQETLLENELFGHERGAFTGASYMKRGLVELSDGGTLFLDEVGEMQVQTQAKILRFLEDRCFRRVGGNVDISVDIRIVAATNVDLARRIEEERFRKDLFYRLQVVSIHLPPLRDRGDDVNLLAQFFLRKFSGELRKAYDTIDDEVRDIFRTYAWPGNVRELRNLIERIVLTEDGQVLTRRHLPSEMLRHVKGAAGPAAMTSPSESAKTSDGQSASPRVRTLREVEEEHILRVLSHCGGNKSRAARVLGLSRQGLLDRLKRLGGSSEAA